MESKTTDKGKKSTEDEKINWLPINTAIYIAAGLFFVFYIHIYSNYSVKSTRITLGEFGDVFGVINALFTLAAFVAAGIAIYMQSHELKLSRKAINLQTTEIGHQKEEMALQRLEFETNRITDVILAQIKKVGQAWEQAMIDNEHELDLNNPKTPNLKGKIGSYSSAEYAGLTISNHRAVEYLKDEDDNPVSPFEMATYFKIIYPAITSLSVAALMVNEYELLIQRYQTEITTNRAHLTKLKQTLQIVIRENLPMHFVRLLDSITLKTFHGKDKIMKAENFMNENKAQENGEAPRMFYEIESYLVVIDNFIGLKHDKGVRELASSIGFENSSKLLDEELRLKKELKDLEKIDESKLKKSQEQRIIRNVTRLQEITEIHMLNKNAAYHTVEKDY